MVKILKSVLLVLLLATFIFTAGAVNAQIPTSTNSADRLKPFRAQGTKDLMARENIKASAGARKAQRLSEARLKICNARSRNISGRIEKLISLGEKSHDARLEIIERVVNYYNDVLVPKGFNLDNYDLLKSDMATKEANVQSLLTNAQTSGQSFSCDSEDTKAQADTFREDIQRLRSANKDYRTSVRNFIVAVRNLAKEAKAEKVSPTPIVVEVVEE